jgi:hypothetical protein
VRNKGNILRAYNSDFSDNIKVGGIYVGVLISLWFFLLRIFLFAAQPKEYFLDGLKKLEQRSHKCVELRGEYGE